MRYLHYISYIVTPIVSSYDCIDLYYYIVGMSPVLRPGWKLSVLYKAYYTESSQKDVWCMILEALSLFPQLFHYSCFIICFIDVYCTCQLGTGQACFHPSPFNFQSSGRGSVFRFCCWRQRIHKENFISFLIFFSLSAVLFSDKKKTISQHWKLQLNPAGYVTT